MSSRAGGSLDLFEKSSMVRDVATSDPSAIEEENLLNKYKQKHKLLEKYTLKSVLEFIDHQYDNKGKVLRIKPEIMAILAVFSELPPYRLFPVSVTAGGASASAGGGSAGHVGHPATADMPAVPPVMPATSLAESPSEGTKEPKGRAVGGHSRSA